MDTIYTNKEFDCKLSGLIVYDGTVFGVTDKRKIWAGVDLKTGETKFTSRDLKPGSFILADNKFYLFSDVGEVALATPSKSGLNIVNKFFIPVVNVKSAFGHPVIYNVILFVRYNSNLWLYKIK